MRVLMVTPRFAPDRGGVEAHVEEVARRLVADHRLAVTVLTTDRGGLLAAAEEVDGVHVIRVPARPRGSDLYWAPDIQRRVRRSGADLVHVQGYHTLVPPLAMIGARRARIPYVVTFHSGGHSSSLRRLIRPLQVAGLRPLLRRAAGLVAVSRFEAEVFSAAGLDARRIATIPNGADFPPGADPGPLERDPGLILSVGRLERYKGHHRVVAALPLIRAAVPDARLMVVGDGPERGRLLQAAREVGMAAHVAIGGRPRADLPALLRRAGVVALLSDYESQGMAAHEALALGARLVVTDATALAELRGRPGVISVIPDADDRLVADAVIRQLWAGPLPVSSTSLPSWSECAAAVAALYAEIVRPSGGSARSR